MVQVIIGEIACISGGDATADSFLSRFDMREIAVLVGCVGHIGETATHLPLPSGGVAGVSQHIPRSIDLGFQAPCWLDRVRISARSRNLISTDIFLQWSA